MKPKTILISSVGSLVGQNILDALMDRRHHLRVLGANSLPDAANNYRCDATFLMPPAIEAVAYRKALKQLIDAQQVDLVIPGRDADVIVLSEMREDHPQWAGRLMVGALDAARVMDDKYSSYQFSQQRGLPFAPTVASDDIDVQPKTALLLKQFGFPLIAKPRQGNGSRGIRILTNASHLARAVTQPGLAIQPMLDAQGDLDLDLRDGVPFFWGVPESHLYASQSLIHSDGLLGPSFGFISRMVAGRCERMTPCIDQDLLAISHRYGVAMAQIGWRGPLNLQLKRDPKVGMQVIEMNGRFSGGTSARRHLGFDEVALSINQWLQETVVPVDHPAVGVNSFVAKSLGDFPVPSVGVQSMEQEGQWPSSC